MSEFWPTRAAENRRDPFVPSRASLRFVPLQVVDDFLL
jgi:hypothetical protein